MKAVKPTDFHAQDPTPVDKKIIGCLPKRLFLHSHIMMLQNFAAQSPIISCEAVISSPNFSMFSPPRRAYLQ